MDPYRFTTLAHAGRDWLGPVSPGTFGRILDTLPAPPADVLDVGCGKGAMLAILLARHRACVAIGIEPNPAFAAAARESLGHAGVSERATVIVHPLERVTLPERGFDLVMCVGATQAFGDTHDAMAGSARLTRAGGHVLVGEGHWRRTPEPGYLDLLGCGPAAHTTLAGTTALGRNLGLEPVVSFESTPAEWDDYEDAYAAAVRAWADAHPDDPDAPAFRARIDRWSDGRRRWGHDTLGFALHMFRVSEHS